MKIKLYIIFSLIMYPLLSGAQLKIIIDNPREDSIPEQYRWMGTPYFELPARKITFVKPQNFVIQKSPYCFKGYPMLKYTFGCLGAGVRSQDKQILSFFYFPNIFTNEFGKEMEAMFGGSHQFEDWQHYMQLRAILRKYFGDDYDWHKDLQYYPNWEAKTKFNADTAILVSFPLRKEDYYKRKYKYVDILVLQKQGRGYIYLTCFSTDKAKARFDDYWQKIEGIFRYED